MELNKRIKYDKANRVINKYLNSKNETKPKKYKDKALLTIHLLENDYQDKTINIAHFKKSVMNVDENDPVFQAARFLLTLETKPNDGDNLYTQGCNKYEAIDNEGKTIAKSTSLTSLYRLIHLWIINKKYKAFGRDTFIKKYKENNGQFEWGKVVRIG